MAHHEASGSLLCRPALWPATDRTACLQQQLAACWQAVAVDGPSYHATQCCCLQEPGAASLVSHPRQVQGSVRKSDDSRKRQRQAKAERQAEEAAQRQEELKRLKNLKRADIEARCAPFRQQHSCICKAVGLPATGTAGSQVGSGGLQWSVAHCHARQRAQDSQLEWGPS